MRVKRLVLSAPGHAVPSRNPASVREQTLPLFGQVNGVCVHCNGLDLDELFAIHNLKDLGMGVPLVDLKGFSSRHRDSPCDVCRFLARSTPLLESEVPKTWHVRAFNYAKLRARHEFEKEDSIVDYARALSRRFIPDDIITPENLVLALTPDSIRDHCTQDPEQSLSHCIIPTKRLQYTAFSFRYESRPVEQTFDAEFFYEALENCCESEDHELCRPSHQCLRGFPALNMRVIDCASKAIVNYDYHDAQPYATLSYCIGLKPVENHQPQAQTYGKQWPQVVIDAVKCCNEMCIPYLWVDQLCVDQNDPAKLAEAISCMHKIFSRAYLTIVSLAAQQHDGLPGIGSTLRVPSPRLSTRQNTYVSLPVHLTEALRKSNWMTRGWCYQEAALSPRLLIFGPEQAYFICNSSMYLECMNRELFHTNTLVLEDSGSRTNSQALVFGKGSTIQNAWNFGRWVAAYTARDLTYQSDILNAFRGLLNASPDFNYWGVPFVAKNEDRFRNYAEEFAIGLSWATSYNSDCHDPSWEGLETPIGPDAYQRPEFPSWSWASCKVFKNPICYDGSDWRPLETGKDLDRIVDYSRIAISFEDESGRQMPAADFIQSCQGSLSGLPEVSRFIHIEAETVQLRMCQLTALENEYENNSSGYNDYPYELDYNTNQEFGPYQDEREVDWSGIARFCVDTPQHPRFAPRLEYYVSDPDNDEYMVDFDWPPTTRDSRHTEIDGRVYLGLILFFCPWKPRGGDDIPGAQNLAHRGAYCVLLCERHEAGHYYKRVGRAWIPDGHLKYFTTQRQKIRMG